MIPKLALMKQKIEADREMFNQHIAHTPPALLKMQADELADYAERLEAWTSYLEKWGDREWELDSAWKSMSPLLQEFMADTAALLGYQIATERDNDE